MNQNSYDYFIPQVSFLLPELYLTAITLKKDMDTV